MEGDVSLLFLRLLLQATTTFSYLSVSTPELSQASNPSFLFHPDTRMQCLTVSAKTLSKYSLGMSLMALYMVV